MDEEDKIPFTDHLEELRERIIKSFIAVAVGFAVCYGFKEKIFEIITQPLMSVMQEGDQLIFTGLPEAFFTYLKVAFLAGLILAGPFIIYQFWMFVAPGLYKNERRMMVPIVALSTLFFIGGALFGYFIVFPWGFQFFLSFASESIKALPSMQAYLSFATKLLLVFGLVFELPIVITFLARLGLVTVPFLRQNRKYAILLFFIGSAMITPPDVVTQIMMAFPLMLLYEISIWGAILFGQKSEDKAKNKTNQEQTSTGDAS